MLDGLRVLIVEDDVMIAMMVEEQVAEAGGTVIGPFDTVTRALEVLDAVMLDAAIIDANLLDGVGTPVARRLMQAGVPFLIYSGTGVPDDLQASPSPIPFEMKPGRPVERLCEVMRQHSCARPD